jgi:hypothetical protein
MIAVCAFVAAVEASLIAIASIVAIDTNIHDLVDPNDRMRLFATCCSCCKQQVIRRLNVFPANTNQPKRPQGLNSSETNAICSSPLHVDFQSRTGFKFWFEY